MLVEACFCFLLQLGFRLFLRYKSGDYIENTARESPAPRPEASPAEATDYKAIFHKYNKEFALVFPMHLVCLGFSSSIGPYPFEVVVSFLFLASRILKMVTALFNLSSRVEHLTWHACYITNLVLLISSSMRAAQSSINPNNGLCMTDLS
jgi:hypothetical protein